MKYLFILVLILIVFLVFNENHLENIIVVLMSFMSLWVWKYDEYEYIRWRNRKDPSLYSKVMDIDYETQKRLILSKVNERLFDLKNNDVMIARKSISKLLEQPSYVDVISYTIFDIDSFVDELVNLARAGILSDELVIRTNGMLEECSKLKDLEEIVKNISAEISKELGPIEKSDSDELGPIEKSDSEELELIEKSASEELVELFENTK